MTTLLESKFHKFKIFLEGNNIETINKRLNKVINRYCFYYFSQNNEIYIDQHIHKNIEQTKFIIIDYYQQDPHFIIVFQNTIIIVERTFLKLILIHFGKDHQYTFLNNCKNTIELITGERFTEGKKLDRIYYEEITRFNKELQLKPINKKQNQNQNQNIKEIWNMIKSSISSYLICVGYSKINEDRITKFHEKNKKHEQRIFEEEEYIELRQIGSGSLFYIYLIYHIEFEEIFAIKKLHVKNDESDKLIEREIRNYSEIKHPHISKYYGTTKQNKHVVIEFIYGRPLSEIKKLELSEEDKFTIIFQLLSVFEYLHEHHFIYRDLKPNNIMIDNNKTAILIDFDRMIKDNDEESINSTTNDFGSKYSAPEITSNEFMNKKDIYSIGKIIYFIMNEQYSDDTGITKINYDENSIIQKIYNKCINEDPKERPTISQIVDLFSSLIAYVNSTYLYKLGLYYEELNQINKSIHYYTLAANKNDSAAQFKLGVIYYNNKLIPQDINKSIHYFELAANQND